MAHKTWLFSITLLIIVLTIANPNPVGHRMAILCSECDKESAKCKDAILHGGYNSASTDVTSGKGHRGLPGKRLAKMGKNAGTGISILGGTKRRKTGITYVKPKKKNCKEATCCEDNAKFCRNNCSVG